MSLTIFPWTISNRGWRYPQVLSISYKTRTGTLYFELLLLSASENYAVRLKTLTPTRTGTLYFELLLLSASENYAARLKTLTPDQSALTDKSSFSADIVVSGH
jgi:hypothetical protein